VNIISKGKTHKGHYPGAACLHVFPALAGFVNLYPAAISASNTQRRMFSIETPTAVKND
jgi:hypothetical protein